MIRLWRIGTRLSESVWFWFFLTMALGIVLIATGVIRWG
jgi:hypothetical protein